MEAQLRTNVQKSVKKALIESKFNEEPISFGQALVTYHFLQQQPLQQTYPENMLARSVKQETEQAMQTGRVSIKSPAKTV